MSNVGVIEKLTNFTHKDANGRDWGLNVRQRAKELISLVTDTERIRSERQKVRQAFMPTSWLLFIIHFMHRAASSCNTEQKEIELTCMPPICHIRWCIYRSQRDDQA